MVGKPPIEIVMTWGWSILGFTTAICLRWVFNTINQPWMKPTLANPLDARPNNWVILPTNITIYIYTVIESTNQLVIKWLLLRHRLEFFEYVMIMPKRKTFIHGVQHSIVSVVILISPRLLPKFSLFIVVPICQQYPCQPPVYKP